MPATSRGQQGDDPPTEPEGFLAEPPTGEDAFVSTPAGYAGSADAEAAFGELFERHVDAVWNYAYRLTGSWATAEDVAANTFVVAWRKRDTVDLDGQNPLPWLFAVAANLARTEGRRLGRFRRAVARLPRPEHQPDHADHVVTGLDAEQHQRRIRAAIQTLSAAEREAVELCLLGELSIADAAAALGIAQVSVRSRLSRARAHLRDILKDVSQ